MHRYLKPVVLLAAAAGVLFIAAAGQAGGRTSSALYIVQFSGKPLATYAGGVKGFHATRPVKGARINIRTQNANRYRNYLLNRQHTVLNRAGIASKPVYRFTTVLNGVALKMTAQQASKLRGTPGVSMVEKNRILTIRTSNGNKPDAPPPGPPGHSGSPSSSAQPPTPAFLGLTGKNGVWQKQFGDPATPARASSSVTSTPASGRRTRASPRCNARPDDRDHRGEVPRHLRHRAARTPVTCNNKVIGARCYDAAGLSTANPGEFTRRATSTATARTPHHRRRRLGVEATINGSDVGPLSGMAPAARLSIYKVLYENAANTHGQRQQRRHRRRDRRRHQRRRRRHQLLGRRQRRHVRPRRARVPQRRRRRRLRLGGRRQRRPGRLDGRQRDAVGDHGGRGHVRPRASRTP